MFHGQRCRAKKYPWSFGNLLFAAVGSLLIAAIAHADTSPWLLVDTAARSLSVIQDGVIREQFNNIAYGSGGVADVRLRGERKTPRGEFRIAWVNEKSPFRLFFGFDYPNIDYSKKALQSGRIDWDTYVDILLASARQRVPPQDTILGGHIGIHGLGRANPDIHQEFNWTEGCIALTNEQIERLSHWVRIGTRVVIH
ncbi:MAG: L,D-transpeptidase [Gammaproteobacteria bacterium]